MPPPLISPLPVPPPRPALPADCSMASTLTSVFRDLRVTADDVEDIRNASEMESLCLNCRKDGTTRLLFTRIPHYREVVLMSFECHHCGWKNNELQPASQMQEQGIRISVTCSTPQDLNRQVVRTEWADVCIPELDFSISKQGGMITTIEGLLDRAITGLQDTAVRLAASDPESVLKLTEFVAKMAEIKAGDKSFTFIVDDATGNSFVESLTAPAADPALHITRYSRSREQNQLIGLIADDDDSDTPVSGQNGVSNGTNGVSNRTNGTGGDGISLVPVTRTNGHASGTLEPLTEEENPLDVDPNDLIRGEALEFVTNCNNCFTPCLTKMKITDIPHFKTVIIMATNCDACGERTNEIKSGTGIGEKGVRITMHIGDESKLKTDVVKSDTCGIRIPELDLELESSGAGRYTTLEGLVAHMRLQLQESNPFTTGDSASSDTRLKMQELIQRLDQPIGLTVVLDDPAGNSWSADPDTVEQYVRTFDHDEELGINDMRVQGFGEEKDAAHADQGNQSDTK